MAEDVRHQLWLIYEQLKDAEADSDRRLDLLTRSREELGQVINHLHHLAEPNLYAAMANAGAKGGAAKTNAKAAAARENGRKGGRPAMSEEQKSIQQWFREKGFRVQFHIGSKNVSPDPARPDHRPDHNEKYANIETVGQDGTIRLVRRYKMSASDTIEDSLKRAKELFESDLSSGEIE